MVFAFRKSAPSMLPVEKLVALTRLLQEHSPRQADFLQTLPTLAKIVTARGISVYLYEEKTGVFVLKHWTGTKPGRFSISAEYELVKYLKVNFGPASRQEFLQNSHELRQAALFFFQQTSSNKVFPVLSDDHWIALVTLDVEEDAESAIGHDALVSLYIECLLQWIFFRRTEEKNKKLSELGHVKDQLLANVTHELETPLNAILGFSDAIIEGSDGAVAPEVVTHVRMIRDAGINLHTTVNNILKLTHIEAHKNETQFERVKIFPLVFEVASLYQQAMATKNIECDLSALTKDYDVFIEPDQIRTVFMNLFGNAVKFTQNGKIKVDVHKSGEMLHVMVSDTGIGIDNDKLSLIFEEFYQADGSHTRVYGGAGLGLAIVKKIVTLHGGRIWAESRKGEETQFTFTLPLFPL